MRSRERPAPGSPTGRQSPEPSRVRSRVAIAAGAWTVAVAIAGSMNEVFWLGLPVAAWLVATAAGTVSDGSRPLSRAGARALRFAVIAALVLAAAAAIAVRTTGLEPAWIARSAGSAGALFAAGAAALGLGLAATAGVPRVPSVLFAAAIPIGFAVDGIGSNAVGLPLFFSGSGPVVGLVLLGVSLVWLGTRGLHASSDRSA